MRKRESCLDEAGQGAVLCRAKPPAGQLGFCFAVRSTHFWKISVPFGLLVWAYILQLMFVPTQASEDGLATAAVCWQYANLQQACVDPTILQLPGTALPS